MTVILNRAYGAYPAGAIVELPASTEAALITQNLAQTSAGVPAAGNISSNEMQGLASIAIGAASVTVTNPNVNANTKINAYVRQAVGDTTATAVFRVVPANGSFTIYAPANATAVTTVAWFIEATGLSANQ